MSDHQSVYGAGSKSGLSVGRGMASSTGAESKDIIIAQLMREINELKVQENDYTNFNLQLNNLEKRYSQLKEEKDIKEHDTSKKIQGLLGRLADTRSQIDSLRAELMKKNHDIKNLSDDIESMNQFLIQKNESIKQMSFEGEDLEAKRTQLEKEQSDLKRRISDIDSERTELLNQLQNSEALLQQAIITERQLDQDLGNNDNGVEDSGNAIQDVRGEVDEIQRENDQMRTLINEKDADIDEYEREIQTLEGQISSDEGTKKRLKDQILELNTELTKELHNNNILQNELSKVETTIRGKESEFEECKRLKETVLRKEVSIKESNEQRKLENSDLRNEITKLADLCKDVMKDIERLHEADMNLRQTIDTKNYSDELLRKINNLTC